MNSYFNPGDWLVIVLYLMGIIGLGVWFVKDQHNTRDYFLGSKNIPWWGIGLSIVAVLLLAGMLWRIDRLDMPSAAGLALIFGGAMGNVFDRVRVGSVTDFLDFYAGTYHWYTFNVADTSICAGAGLLILSMFLSQHSGTRSQSSRA